MSVAYNPSNISQTQEHQLAYEYKYSQIIKEGAVTNHDKASDWNKFDLN